MRETIYALTSLSPTGSRHEVARAALRSWRAAGLEPRSFNHPDEIPHLRKLYPDVEFVPTELTSVAEFGRHYVRLDALLTWAKAADSPVLVINADIEVRMAPWELKRLRWTADLTYFIRYNHEGDPARATREKYGIDAFLFHGRDAALFPESFLSLGQPFWDYLIPRTFYNAGRDVQWVGFPVTFHQNHPRAWSPAAWYLCGLEFARATGEEIAGRSHADVLAMSRRVRGSFEGKAFEAKREPLEIRKWVESRFGGPESKTFLELGAHMGTDSEWMSAIPGVILHAFEPDPRNFQLERPNVHVHHLAVGDRDGAAPFVMSAEGWGREWTYSSSLLAPKNHLTRYPTVTFLPGAAEVEVVRLDTFADRYDVERVDFIWADIQGAEAAMVRGGQATLHRTRYLYTEFSDDELYEGQSTLAEVLALLPGRWRVFELWPDNVLLENLSPL